VLRASSVGLVVACVLAGAPVALAQQGTTSYPEELWKAYPLEQRPATQAPAASARRGPAVVSTDEGGGSGSSVWWIVLVAAGATLVLVAVSWERLRRTRQGPAVPALVVPTNWSEPPSKPRPERSARPPDPVCQVRWSPRGSFYAVTTDANGTERVVARSPRVDAHGPEPPDQEPELDAALKVLSKQVRDLGWRPLRARGIDFDERRWYARRFRWPTEADTQGGGEAPPRRAGVHANKGDAR
jgi:hypothetical protein